MKTQQRLIALLAVLPLLAGSAVPGQGQSGVQGRQQALQGRELPQGHREVRARDRARPGHGRGLLLPGQRPPGALPAGQGKRREQAAAGAGHPELLEVPRGQQGEYREPEEGEGHHPRRPDRDLLGAALPGLREGPRATPSSSPRTTRTTPRTSMRSRTSTRSSARSTTRRRPTSGSPSCTPDDVKACSALAGFYNKPLWDDQGASTTRRRPRADAARSSTSRSTPCSAAPPWTRRMRPATSRSPQFYWDKAYRDPTVTEAQKATYADKGMEAVEKAIEIKPDYWEAIIFKGLLYRVKAQIDQEPARSARSSWSRPRRSRSGPWTSRSRSRPRARRCRPRRRPAPAGGEAPAPPK